MKSFAHIDAATVEEACGILAEHGGRAVANAGGTDLLGALKDGIHTTYPEVVVNLKTIPGLDHVTRDDRGLRIGVLTRLATIVESEAVQAACAILAQAARAVATPQIRNVGTLGGNLCQEVRCWYYRYPRHLGGPVDCLRKGSRGCPAVKGDNRYHAVIGGRGCHAVCPSDTAVALTALGATVIVAGPGESTREMPVEHLYATTEITLRPGELLTEVRVPAPAAGTRQSFLRHTVREPVDFALASAAAVLTVHDGVCESARIVLGGVAAGPQRVEAAEALLRGSRLDAGVAEKAASLVLAGAKPLKDNAYKIAIARSLVERALLATIDRT